MTTPQNTCYCTICKKNVTFHIKIVDHKKELMRTLFTLGLWLPMWMGLALVKIKVCDSCGQTVSEG